MADIISIDGKLKKAKDREEALFHLRKIKAARSVLQHRRNLHVCERCGFDIGTGTTDAAQSAEHPHAPYRFCDACGAEYADYIRRLQGGGDAMHYWQDDIWMDTWQRWIEYHGSVDRFLQSKMFRRLLEDIQQSPSHD